jgi:LemA protein
MHWLIIIGIIVLLVLWLVSVQRKLVGLDENVNNAFNQISVLLESRFDALKALLDIAKGYAAHEFETITVAVSARSGKVTTAAEVDVSNEFITKAASKINIVAEQYPELRANENYIKLMDSVNDYEKSVRQGRLVYNDTVTKLNRALRMFPTSLVGGMLGFKLRDYLAKDQSKSQMPDMK